MIMDDLISRVRDVNPYRSRANITRRLAKVLEELGEASEACLSVSSPQNYKDKTWVDYREEAIDTLIVLIDVALTEITNYPPSALLGSGIALAFDHHYEDEDSLLDQKFVIASAVGDAAAHLKDNHPMAFYGAIKRGIQAAANMCFAAIPEDHDRATIEARVRSQFETKIEKWINSLNVRQAFEAAQ